MAQTNKEEIGKDNFESWLFAFYPDIAFLDNHLTYEQYTDMCRYYGASEVDDAMDILYAECKFVEGCNPHQLILERVIEIMRRKEWKSTCDKFVVIPLIDYLNSNAGNFEAIEKVRKALEKEGIRCARKK